MDEEDRNSLPAHLLGPYVAAAAHEAANGRPLRSRDLMALRVAVVQVEAELAALEGMKPPQLTASRAALVAPAGPSLEFASLALSATADRWPGEGLFDRVVRLQRLVDLVKATEAGDPEAAAEVAEVFDVIVEELFFDRSPILLAEV